MCVKDKFSSKKMLKNSLMSVFKTFMVAIVGVKTTDTFNGLMIH